jgi:hypothetical protein
MRASGARISFIKSVGPCCHKGVDHVTENRIVTTYKVQYNRGCALRLRGTREIALSRDNCHQMAAGELRKQNGRFKHILYELIFPWQWDSHCGLQNYDIWQCRCMQCLKEMDCLLLEDENHKDINLLTLRSWTLHERSPVMKPLESFPSLLCNPKVLYPIHKSPPLVPIQSQINPFNSTPILSF